MDVDFIKESVEEGDHGIIIKKPLQLIKYGKTLTIQPVKWAQCDDFLYYMGIFLYEYYVMFGDENMPSKIKLSSKFVEKFRRVMVNKKALKAIFKMAKISGMSPRWMRKNFSIHDFAEIFVWMYFFNVHAVKKNFSIALKMISPHLLA